MSHYEDQRANWYEGIKQTTKPVNNNNTAIHDLVINDLSMRKAFGLEKYGTPLQAFNQRKALQDAYEEALDLVCYLKQKLEEDAISSKT